MTATPEPTATLLIGRSSSTCGHCGEPTLVTGVTHHTDVSGWSPEPGAGCGARFVDMRPVEGVSAASLRALRDDLPIRA